MLTLFWDERGLIFEHYMPRGNTVTSATYADLKNRLHPAIKSKRRRCLSTGVLLQQLNGQYGAKHCNVVTKHLYSEVHVVWTLLQDAGDS